MPDAVWYDYETVSNTDSSSRTLRDHNFGRVDKREASTHGLSFSVVFSVTSARLMNRA